MTPADTIADFARYRELKREWEAANPGASCAEHAAAMQRLAYECGVWCERSSSAP